MLRTAVLIYESGCIGSRPDRLPASIGDGVLSETAVANVGVVEIFSYWLQAGRIDVGFSGRGPNRPIRQHKHDRYWCL